MKEHSNGFLTSCLWARNPRIYPTEDVNEISSFAPSFANEAWELSKGKLLEGQGTNKITVDTSSIGKGEISCIDLKLQVEDGYRAVMKSRFSIWEESICKEAIAT